MAAKKDSSVDQQTSSKVEIVQGAAQAAEQMEMKIIVLENVVLFPGNTIPLMSLDGLSPEARITNRTLIRVGVVSLPGPVDGIKRALEENLPLVGTEAFITAGAQTINGRFTPQLKGLRRFVVDEFVKSGRGYSAKVSLADDKPFKRTAKFLASVAALNTLVAREC